MKNQQNMMLLAIFLTLATTSIQAAGFRLLQVSDPGHKDLQVGLWYPTDQPVATEPNTRYGLSVAMDAPVSDTNQGLVILSHGFGGWYAGHADTAIALVQAGFMVAAPSHNGNTWSDMSSSIDQWAVDRPRHMSQVLDYLLNDNELKAHFDQEKVAVYGFSAGGYTALGLIGGVPDLQYAAQHCTANPSEFVCTEKMIDAMLEAKMHELPDSAWGVDPRFKAAAIAAPGLGFAYTSASLARVTAKVQLWSGNLDESVLTETNAAAIADRLPQEPETHWIDKANHFAFMILACREAFKKEDPQEYEMVCSDADGFDRRQFHTDMHREMVRFFRSSLDLQ